MMQQVYGTANFEISRGYVKQLQIVCHDRLMPGLWLLVKLSSEEKSSDESSVDEASGAALGLEAQGYCARNPGLRQARDGGTV
jgi:hypothetical protein